MKAESTLRHAQHGLAVAAMLAWSVATAPAQGLAVNWWTIDGGGGTSTGGVFTVTGTVGQPDTGRMAGGRFVIESGYWGIIAAIQGEEEAPPLTVVATNGAVIVQWALAAEGWVLDQTPTLSGATIPWAQVAASHYLTNEHHIFVKVDPPSGNAFYRLRRR